MKTRIAGIMNSALYGMISGDSVGPNIIPTEKTIPVIMLKYASGIGRPDCSDFGAENARGKRLGTKKRVVSAKWLPEFLKRCQKIPTAVVLSTLWPPRSEIVVN